LTPTTETESLDDSAVPVFRSHKWTSEDTNIVGLNFGLAEMLRHYWGLPVQHDEVQAARRRAIEHPHRELARRVVVVDEDDVEAWPLRLRPNLGARPRLGIGFLG
jgi:hypothetical protein